MLDKALVVETTLAWALSTRSSNLSPSKSRILCALAVEEAVKARASIALAGIEPPWRVVPRVSRALAWARNPQAQDTPVAKPTNAPTVVSRCQSGRPTLVHTQVIAVAAGLFIFSMSETIPGSLDHDELPPLSLPVVLELPPSLPFGVLSMVDD